MSMSRYGAVQFGLASLLMALLTCKVGAQDLESEAVNRSCYEIAVPQSTTQPQRPLRINKCTGETWILAATSTARRKRAHTYRWIPLDVDKLEIGTPGAIDTSHQTDTRTFSQDNCFEFLARRFCE
jgi:hypothetical protein